MSSVKNYYYALRSDWRGFLHLCGIERVPDIFLTATVARTQVADRLPLPDMFLPDYIGKLLWSTLALKLYATIRALVVLDVTPPSILFYSSFSTVWTLFLDMMCSF